MREKGGRERRRRRVETFVTTVLQKDESSGDETVSSSMARFCFGRMDWSERVFRVTNIDRAKKGSRRYLRDEIDYGMICMKSSPNDDND